MDYNTLQSKKSINISNLDVFILILKGKEDMKEICLENCKSLLKIMNKPILFYQLEFLERQGIKEVHLIINKDDVVKTDVFLSQYQGTIKTDFIESNKEGLDLLNVIKNKITKSNFILIEGDSLLSFNLSEFIDSHIDNKNLLSLILQKKEVQQNKLTFLKKETVDVFGIDKENNRIIFYTQRESPNDKEKIIMPKNILNHCKKFNLLFNYFDAGVYLFNKSIFYIFESEEFKSDKENNKVKNNKNKEINNDNFYSIKDDFIPYLIKKSFYKKINNILINKNKNKLINAERVIIKAKLINNTNEKDINNSINNEYCYKIIDYPCYLSTIDELKKPYDNILPIFFQTKNNDKNYFFNFMEKIEDNVENHKMFNDNIPELECISMDSYIADKIGVIEKGSTIKQTVAGPNLKVKEGAKITSCLIGLNVIIGKDCQITNCIIGDNTYLGDNCCISDCIIEDNYNINEKTNVTKKILSKFKEDDIEF